MSNRNFEAIFNRFPSDQIYAPLSLYNLYINYTQKEQFKKQKEVKEELIKNYPNSIYTKVLINPDYLANINVQENIFERNYQEVFLSYKNGFFDEVLEKTEIIASDNYKNKYL